MNDLVHQMILLRLSVGTLGQRGHGNWWDCNFLDESGLESLEYNFPKSPLAAGFRATCIAAKRLHDEKIGRSGVTHLFRLEPELEMLVQRATAGALLRTLPRDQESCMALLEEMAGEEIDSPEGPVQVGQLAQADTPQGLAALARHYHAGFRTGSRIFPYFASRGA